LHPDQELPGFPVSMSQAFTLHELDQGAPLSQRELADRLALEKSTISRMVADLEQKGLVERERDPANRRTYRIRLTDKGHDTHVEIGTGYQDRFDRWAEALSGDERAALLAGLPALIRVVRAG
jgi:DNA-binding MarR family transcriptional regulator